MIAIFIGPFLDGAAGKDNAAGESSLLEPIEIRRACFHRIKATMRHPSDIRRRHVETERLLLAPHTIEDFRDCLEMWRDPEVTRLTTGRPSTEEEVWSRLQRYAGLWALHGYGYWVIRDRRTGAFVGEAGFADFRRALDPPLGDAPEIGWALVPRAWGQGLATEAVRAAVAWADLTLRANRTVCLIHPDNRASLRVAEKCGYGAYAETTCKDTPVVLFERIVRPA